MTAPALPKVLSGNDRLRLNWPQILWWSTIQAGIVLAPFTFSWSGLVVCVALCVLAPATQA